MIAKLQIESAGNSEPLRLKGTLDIYAADAAREALFNHLTDRGTLVLDLSGVEGCDAAGLQILIAARKSAQKIGKLFKLVAASSAVDECARSLGIPASEMPAPTK